MTKRKVKRVLGWRPQLPDYRDFIFDAYADSELVLHSSVDLREVCPPVYDQGQLGSCTGNAWAAEYEFEKMAQGTFYWVPSRLFIYYNERVLEGTVKYDAGAYLRDGIKTLVKQGVCPEAEWPYIIKKFKTKPYESCYKDAVKNEALVYSRVPQTPAQLKGCLALGHPFVFGFTVYSSFMTDDVATTGIMPMPQPGDIVEGGHAVMCVGYDDERKVYILRNSWGTDWGDIGYFYMPYDYMHNVNLCSDFWTIKLIS